MYIYTYFPPFNPKTSFTQYSILGFFPFNSVSWREAHISSQGASSLSLLPGISAHA